MRPTNLERARTANDALIVLDELSRGSRNQPYLAAKVARWSVDGLLDKLRHRGLVERTVPGTSSPWRLTLAGRRYVAQVRELDRARLVAEIIEASS